LIRKKAFAGAQSPRGVPCYIEAASGPGDRWVFCRKAKYLEESPDSTG
jgi:hypothetical protein